MHLFASRFLGLSALIVAFAINLFAGSYSTSGQTLPEYPAIDDSPRTESASPFDVPANDVTGRPETDSPSVPIGADHERSVTPVVEFAVNLEQFAREDESSIRISIGLSEAATADLDVKYTIGGNAESTQDYTIRNAGVVTIDVSENPHNADIVINLIDDNVYEGNETVILTLTDGAGYTVGSQKTLTLTIEDNEEPPVPELYFASASGNVNEGAGTHNVRININHPSTETFILHFEVERQNAMATINADYRLDGGFTVSVPANASSVSIPVTVLDDNLEEGNETLTIMLIPEIQLGGIYTLGTPSEHTLTIIDNEGTVLPQAAFSSASENVDEDIGIQNVTVNLSSPAPAGGLSLNYGLTGSASKDIDYRITNSGTVSIAAGGSSATIQIEIINDTAVEGVETVILTLTNGTGYTIGSVNEHILTITDNDEPVTSDVAFASASASVDEDAGTHDITINIDPAPQANLTLNYDLGGTATEGEDYSITSSGTVSVTAGETSVNIPVVIIDDSTEDDGETIILTLTDGAEYDVGSTDTHTLTITDNDRPEVTFASASASVDEDAGTHDITINIDPVPQADLTLNYDLGGTATEGEDYSISGSGTVAVTAGETSVNIPVVITDDNNDEDNETITLTLAGGTGYDVGNANIHTLTITDNDTTPEAAFASASASVDEDADTHNILVNIVPAPQADLALSYDLSGAAVEGEDYSISGSGTVAVTAGETSVNIPVMITDDNEDEENETIVLTLTSGAGYEVGDVNTHTLTITDNDMTPEAAFYSASASVAEDAGTHNVAVRILPAPESDLTLSYGLEGTAKEEADYSIVNSGTISVAAGVDSVNIAILIADDSEDESDETVILTLTSGAGYSVESMKVYTLTITDNDATLTLSVTPNPVSEGEDVTVMATLSEAASSEISIPLVLTAGTAEEGDYGALSAIVIDKDERSGTGMIVTSLDSDLDDETFTITFGTLPAGILAGTPASVEVEITDAGERTSIESRGEEIPSEFSLAQNYPNPFNPSTAIEFSITKPQHVTLTVYDLLGQKIRTLLEGVQSAGRYNVSFVGTGLASDTYLYVLQTEEHRAVKKMTFLK